MTSFEFELCNNLMAGLTLRAIEERFPCFSNLSCADFKNMSTTITVSIQCRQEDARAIEEYLEPFFAEED